MDLRGKTWKEDAVGYARSAHRDGKCVQNYGWKDHTEN
jgi:hypothetical protein